MSFLAGGEGTTITRDLSNAPFVGPGIAAKDPFKF